MKNLKKIAGIWMLRDGVLPPPAKLQPTKKCTFDALIVFDKSDNDIEHEKNILAIKQLVDSTDIPVIATGAVKRLEDVKKLIYAGARRVLIENDCPDADALIKEAALRFGDDCVAEYPGGFVVVPEESADDAKLMAEILSKDDVIGVASEGFLSPHLPQLDVAGVKWSLEIKGIETGRFTPDITWDELIKNDKGLIPVVVQDFVNDEVLMVAWMNEDAFYKTMKLGRMVYYSRSRQEIWYKGSTSGHFQYVKSISADCDKDTLLAKVIQVGAACHTGARSCFFNEVVSSGEHAKNPRKVFDDVYATILDRREHPKEGSYTNYLFDKGIDKILKKVGEEATEIVIAAKNPNSEELKYEISDFLYHVMVLMAERGVSWDDIADELSRR